MFPIVLPPGRYALRVAARSAALDKVGSVYTDVEVPDFRKLPLALSGLVLARSTSSPVLDAAVARVLPFLPTTAREFAPTDTVTAFTRIHQGNDGPVSAVTISLRIVNDRDTIVFMREEVYTANRFNPKTRAADFQFDLPLTSLRAGPHLLSVQATMGRRTAVREVRFRAR